MTQKNTFNTPLRARLWDFLGSMRLAISLLSILAIASAVGTLVKQDEPMVNYISQFGVFWAQWFSILGLFDVYNQFWFLAILAFLLISTSVCLIRNTPKMLHDLRSFKHHTRTNSLRHLPEHIDWTSTESLDKLTKNSVNILQKQGYQVRAQENEAGVYIAAKCGRLSRLGYILTHLAIVVICIGGLMDSELSIRAQVMFLGKQPLLNSQNIGSVPQSAILADNTLSYRGNVSIPEGGVVDYVELNYDQNHLLYQSLPFAIRLNRFVVDYYSTGMPKSFVSNVTVQDKVTGKEITQDIAVNHPLRYKGVGIYQASFGDGGSKLHLQVYPLTGTVATPAIIDSEMFKAPTISYAGKDYTLEWNELRPMNIEPVDNGQKNLSNSNLETSLTQAMSTTGDKHFKNQGPVIRFTLRDNQGQAIEFRNYMQPILVGDIPMIYSGMRTDPNQDFQYFAIPADEDQSVGDFMRLRAALANSEIRKKAVDQYVAAQTLTNKMSPELMRQSAEKTIDLMAKGDDSLERFLRSAPPEQRETIIKFVLSQLQGTMWQLMQISREQAHLPALKENDRSAAFMRIATQRLSETSDYKAPIYVQLAGFDQKQASVLQMTRSPGQFWVYMGSLMLVLGTLAMTFIRERRVWLHIKPSGTAYNLTLAMSSTRRTFDYQNAWKALRDALKPNI